MATYRRVVEIYTGDGSSLYRTCRVDLPADADNDDKSTSFEALRQQWQQRYDTRVRFVEPRQGQEIPGYVPPLPGETNWEWGDDDELEEF